MQNNLTIPKLNSQINGLKEYFKFYNKNEQFEKLEEIQTKLSNQEYKIGVVANMSAGKSTLINAFFGKEILPSLNEATTDCATFIYSTTKENKRAVIYQDSRDTELDEYSLEEIKKYALKDESLKKQEQDEGIDNTKYKNVNKIDLYYPFKKIQSNKDEDLNVIFIDTPGPNNKGSSAEKHESITQDVINRVDMLFVVFDFGQLDANLSDGLWNTIKERVEKDKNFVVYFLINKIDLAIDDNFKSNSYTEEYWYKKEKESEENLKKAIEKHEIAKFKIFLISSKLALLKRDKDINPKKKRIIRDILEDIRDIFGDNINHEEKLIEYVGIEKLENDINNYINNEAKYNLLLSINLEIENILKEEENELRRSEQTLKKPKEEAEERLKKASEFLQNDAIKLENDMKAASSKIQQNAKIEIKKLIDERIKRDFTNKIEEISYRSMQYIKFYVDSYNSIEAKQSVDKLNLNNIKQNFKSNILEEELFKIKSKTELTTNIVNALINGMNDYIEQKLLECKNSYLNIKSDIKNFYHEFDKNSTELFFTYKNNLEDNIDSELNIEKESIQTHKIELSMIENVIINIPSSNLEYNYQSAQYKSNKVWYKPWSWFDEDTKTQDEEYYLVIKPNQNYKNIKESIKTFIETFYNNELAQHYNKIEIHSKTFEDMFQDFRHKKDKEIDTLQRKIKEQEKNLEELNIKISKFQKIKEIN